MLWMGLNLFQALKPKRSVALIQHARHGPGPGEQPGFSVLLEGALKQRQEVAA